MLNSSLMITTDSFFRLIFKTILLLVFLFGGFIQFFVGVPSTLYALIIFLGIYSLIILHTLISRKIYLSKLFIVSFIYLFVIVLNGVVNKTDLFKTLLYFIFPLTPLGVFYLYRIFQKRGLDIENFVNSFFKLVAIIQLPIILIQKYGYNFLIQFNNSNQRINDYDSMFGSFFIKADHALGFFLLLYIMNIIFKLRQNKLKKIPWGMLFYLSITILIMESNLSKLMLFLVLSYYFFLWLYSKINVIGIFVMFFVGILMFNLALKVPAIEGQHEYFKTKYNKETSLHAFKEGYAKRPQVIVTYATHIPVKLIGDGPYDYYNIFKGKFKQTKHFSQLIWTYNDLGLIGVFIIILLAYFMIKRLSLSKESTFLFMVILLFYLFLTNVFSDLAMMLSFILLNNVKKVKVNHSHGPIIKLN